VSTVKNRVDDPRRYLREIEWTQVYRTILIISFCILMSGCLAVANLLTDEGGRNLISPESEVPLVYGGVRAGLECLHITGPSGTNNMELFCLIDLPFSMIADTVCLPYTLYQSKAKKNNDTQDKSRVKDNAPEAPGTK
jgi:uncharacterized protein YceK